MVSSSPCLRWTQASSLSLRRGIPFHHKHDATLRSQARTSENYVKATFAEFSSVLINSSMLLWSPDQGLKDLLFAVCWPWFGSVEFIFDLPIGQIATFSTG